MLAPQDPKQKPKTQFHQSAYLLLTELFRGILMLNGKDNLGKIELNMNISIPGNMIALLTIVIGLLAIGFH